MRVTARRLVVLIWICFVMRGAFYSVLLPLWEGYDEWAHFSYVEMLASGGGLPVLGQTRVSREVAESLKLTPLPYGHHELAAPRLTHDDYWRLPANERVERRRRLVSMPREWARQPAFEPLFNYEAQHPPLYYLMLSPIQAVAANASLPERVLLMRLASVLLASLIVPLSFVVARDVLSCEGSGAALAALLAAMPGLLMPASRVANDGISAVLFGLLLVLTLRGSRPILAGVVLGAGLLTKAYFLTAIPVLVMVAIWRFWRGGVSRRRLAIDAAITFLTAAAIAGWWYWRNYVLYGSWSGLQQVAGNRTVQLTDLVRQIPQVNWLRFLDSVFLTHLWSGNWSFLQVRSWMYRIFEVLALAALLGLVILMWRRRGGRSSVLVLGGFVGFFWLGLAYHELTFSVLGLFSGAGWYLCAVVLAEGLVAVLGLTALLPERRRAWLFPAGAFLFVLLDLYATHFLLLPYYTGLTAHRPGGALASFHLGQLGEGGFKLMMGRLMAPAPAAIALWTGYVTATVALPFLADRAARGKLS